MAYPQHTPYAYNSPYLLPQDDEPFGSSISADPPHQPQDMNSSQQQSNSYQEQYHHMLPPHQSTFQQPMPQAMPPRMHQAYASPYHQQQQLIAPYMAPGQLVVQQQQQMMALPMPHGSPVFQQQQQAMPPPMIPCHPFLQEQQQLMAPPMPPGYSILQQQQPLMSPRLTSGYAMTPSPFPWLMTPQMSLGYTQPLHQEQPAMEPRKTPGHTIDVQRADRFPDSSLYPVADAAEEQAAIRLGWEKANNARLERHKAEEKVGAERFRIAKEHARRVARIKALRSDPAAPFRDYHEWILNYPLGPGEKMNQYHLSLLANRSLEGLEVGSDAYEAIAYAKEFWDEYLTHEDFDIALKRSKEIRAKRGPAADDSVQRVQVDLQGLLANSSISHLEQPDSEPFDEELFRQILTAAIAELDGKA